MTQTIQQKIVINLKELAEILNLGMNNALNLVNSKDFYPSFRIGRKWLISTEKLSQWINEQSGNKEA